MTIVVVGGGGREHAIIKKLKQNPDVETVYCLPGNGGIAFDAICVPEIKATDIEGVTAFATAHKADLVVVAPDDPLAAGMVDAWRRSVSAPSARMRLRHASKPARCSPKI